jgi:hypothetical protein
MPARYKGREKVYVLLLSISLILLASSFSSSIAFWAGTIYLDNGGTRHRVRQIVVHEGYDEGDAWKNDIAVVEV